MNDITSSLPFPAALPQLPIERVWRNGKFWIATVYAAAVLMTLLEIGLILAVFGLLSDSETGAALKIGATAIVILRLVFMLWGLAGKYRKNTATFDAVSVTFHKGTDDAAPISVPFEKIDKISTWSGSTIAIQ